MKSTVQSQSIIFFVILLTIGVCFTPVSSTKTVNLILDPLEGTIDSQVLYSPLDGTTTYLIDNTGAVNHTWLSSYKPGAAVYWLGNGTILRSIKTDTYRGRESGGGVQKVEWDGTIAWDYRYDSGGKMSHHDIEPLPNGNVLMIAWETKTRTEAIAHGRDPSTVTYQGLMPDHIIEVQPTGPTGGEIVWEWHVWDHLIQDYDPSKENYGVVGDHPELVDINFGNFFLSNTVWLHSNSIDYHPEFDQILLSVHNFDEIWVIDHSTTIKEAAGHMGGNSGKGGDLLYRWGNPEAYRAGTVSDQKLFGQHDASWIKPGCPGEGNILVFNNGIDRPDGQYSSVDEFTPPVNVTGGYYLKPGSAYGPENLFWSYSANPPTSFFSYFMSGAERLPTGNTLICNGDEGKFLEVTPEKEIVWQYINPYPTYYSNSVFKIVYIPPGETPEPQTPDLNGEGSLSWSNIKPGATVYGTFKIQNSGSPNSSLNWKIQSYPSWGAWAFSPESGEHLTPEDGKVSIQVSVITPDQGDEEFGGSLRVINKDDSNDILDIPILLTTPTNKVTVHMNSYHFSFIRHSVLYQILHHLFQYRR